MLSEAWQQTIGDLLKLSDWTTLGQKAALKADLNGPTTEMSRAAAVYNAADPVLWDSPIGRQSLLLASLAYREASWRENP